MAVKDAVSGVKYERIFRRPNISAKRLICLSRYAIISERTIDASLLTREAEQITPVVYLFGITIAMSFFLSRCNLQCGN